MFGSVGHSFSSTALLGGSSSSGGTDTVVQAGTTITTSFSLLQGDKLDLTQILAGVNLNPNLSNLSQYVTVIDHANAGGVSATLTVTGPNGTGVVNLEDSGNLSLKGLLNHNSLILPPH